VDKSKRDSIHGINWPFQVSSLAIDFSVPQPIDAVMAAMKTMQVTVTPLEIVFIQVDHGTYRFHLTTRALRSHLVEANGFLKRAGDQQTQLKGQVMGNPNPASIFGFTLLVGLLTILSFPSFLIGLIVGLLVIAVAWYCRQSQQQAFADQEKLLTLIRQQFISIN
jgi:hypothetical protein